MKARATLPENLEAPSLATMMTGETGWTLAWAMWVDSERHCWLHPAYPAEKEAHGTARMRVELRDDGYHVWPVAGHRYSPNEQPGFALSDGTEYIPVVELHDANP